MSGSFADPGVHPHFRCASPACTSVQACTSILDAPAHVHFYTDVHFHIRGVSPACICFDMRCSTPVFTPMPRALFHHALPHMCASPNRKLWPSGTHFHIWRADPARTSILGAPILACTLRRSMRMRWCCGWCGGAILYAEQLGAVVEWSTTSSRYWV